MKKIFYKVFLICIIFFSSFTFAALAEAGEPDITPPTGTISINNGDESTDSQFVTLNLTVTDNASPKEDILVQYSNDNLTFGTEVNEEGIIQNEGTWEPYPVETNTKTWTLAKGEYTGDRGVYVKFKDAARNISFSSETPVDMGGLVGLWKLNESPAVNHTEIIDSKDVNNGIFHTSEEANDKSISGVHDRAINFDGIDDLVTIRDVFDFDGLQPYTFTVWINPTDISTTGWRRIISKEVTTTKGR